MLISEHTYVLRALRLTVANFHPGNLTQWTILRSDSSLSTLIVSWLSRSVRRLCALRRFIRTLYSDKSGRDLLFLLFGRFDLASFPPSGIFPTSSSIYQQAKSNRLPIQPRTRWKNGGQARGRSTGYRRNALGDTLVMPPSVLVIHAPYTPTDCLLAGGMFWNFYARAQLAPNLAYIKESSDWITNETPPGDVEWDDIVRRMRSGSRPC